MHFRLVLVVLFIAGCGNRIETDPPGTVSEEPSSPVEGEPTPAPSDTLVLPATITDTLIVEGEPEPVTLRLIREDDGPLPFATYITNDLDYDASASDEGSGYRFTLGDPDDMYYAMLNAFVPSEESGMDDPRAYAQALAGEGVELQQLGDARPWVEAGYTWFADGRMGSVQAGTRDGRRFYVVEDMQEEMGDGWGPRAAMILDRWRWLPEGTPLTR